MILSPSVVLRIALAGALFAAVVLSACVRGPVRTPPAAELRRMIGSALALDAVGAIALLAGLGTLAAVVSAAGIAVAALAAWLSRGREGREPPGGDDPPHDPPPDDEGGGPVDWDQFERELGEYAAARQPTAASSSSCSRVSPVSSG